MDSASRLQCSPPRMSQSVGAVERGSNALEIAAKGEVVRYLAGDKEITKIGIHADIFGRYAALELGPLLILSLFAYDWRGLCNAA